MLMTIHTLSLDTVLQTKHTQAVSVNEVGIVCDRVHLLHQSDTGSQGKKPKDWYHSGLNIYYTADQKEFLKL